MSLPRSMHHSAVGHVQPLRQLLPSVARLVESGAIISTAAVSKLHFRSAAQSRSSGTRRGGGNR